MSGLFFSVFRGVVRGIFGNIFAEIEYCCLIEIIEQKKFQKSGDGLDEVEH